MASVNLCLFEGLGLLASRGKVVPVHMVNANQREATAREELERAITWRVIAEANILQQVTAAVAMLGSHSGDRKRRDRPAVVAARVAGDLTPSWRAPLAQRAHEVCRLIPTAGAASHEAASTQSR